MGLSRCRAWVLAATLTPIGVGCGLARAQDRSTPSLTPPAATGSASGSTADPNDLPPVFLPPESMIERMTRDSGPTNRPLTGPRPGVLRRPIEASSSPDWLQQFFDIGPFLQLPMDPPTGYTGASGVLPTESQQSSHFVPVEDRWRIGYPAWDRYDRGHPITDDYPYMPGRLLDPFNLNVFKGDYPILGQHTFLDISADRQPRLRRPRDPDPDLRVREHGAAILRKLLWPSEQLLYAQLLLVLVRPVSRGRGVQAGRLADQAGPNPGGQQLLVQRAGADQPERPPGDHAYSRSLALQEAFAEYKLADLGPDYDFLSVRAGNQPFNADFRGFLFSDINRGIRLFGTQNSNRDQFNLVYFRQWEKDTNTGLNTFNDRGQNLIFANYYRQDFIFPGYTAQVSLNYDNDPASIKFDKNRFLVRPDPVGNFQPHEVDVAYLGIAGDGHWGRYNLTNQFYWAFGRDSMNPLANRPQTINAQMAAIEGSYDRDWVRYRLSFFWASGDGNVNDTHATGFDTILDAPNFAGGQFSFWNRQQIGLQGVNLVQRLSLVPDLRSSKIQGQANFVNPGLILPTFGMDFDVTPKLKVITNYNLVWFDKTAPLQQFVFQGNIDRFVGFDIGYGFEYRPLLSENVAIVGGVQMLIPGQGFRDLYNNFDNRVGGLVAGFLNSVFTF